MVAVSVTPMELDEIAPKEEKIKEVRTTVASLRLDAVASSGFSVSRTKLVSAVNAGLLQVNWQPAKGPSQEVKEGDIISMRGRGRMKVEAITGTSRKGRIGVYLKRFM
jgi:S4 domain protein